MLMLDRDRNESINIGDDIEVIVLCCSRRRVRLGIVAPKAVPVFRNEIYRQIKEKHTVESIHGTRSK